MAATPLCEAPLAALKKSLRDEFPHVKSSHLSEALAHSLGFRTYAAMQAAMVGPEQDRPFALLQTQRFVERLKQLGYEVDPEFDFEMTILTPVPGVVSTVPDSAYDIEYKTTRQKAWRNLLVCAVNAALEQKLFTLRPGDNRFPDKMRRGEVFDFVLPNGLPARGSVSDAGFNELSVHAAVNPKGDMVRAFNGGFDAGDAFGTTWVERERGAWMQSSDSSFNCRKGLLDHLAALQVEPMGYGDRGRVIM
ncbi:hypothetical protein [Rubrivivax benzoatilyticus]|nr:hypothetical protein [Rubrivivax benzoatilyticus]EGJ11218.1 hypothetical protein RBXJA2T_12857 [Rubrivivax benzoatilyticus JA2 = ATCC BAA-35]